MKAMTSMALAPQINRVGTIIIDKATPDTRDKPAATMPSKKNGIKAEIISNIIFLPSLYKFKYIVSTTLHQGEIYFFIASRFLTAEAEHPIICAILATPYPLARRFFMLFSSNCKVLVRISMPCSRR